MDSSTIMRWTRSAASNGSSATLLAARAKRHGAKQKILEFAALTREVRRQQAAVVLEIGTFKGGTLWAWCRVARRDALLVSVDLPGGEFGGGYDEHSVERLRGYARSEQQLELIRGDSHSQQTFARVQRALGGRRVDFLFIDGDHTYEGVRRDFDMYRPLVRRSGLIAFHDVLPHNADANCQVDRLWSEVKSQYRSREFSDPDDVRWDGAWGGIGVLYA